jgi:hypothetical protein
MPDKQLKGVIMVIKQQAQELHEELNSDLQVT